MMRTSAPTRREIFLVGSLLLILVALSHFDFNISSSSRMAGADPGSKSKTFLNYELPSLSLSRPEQDAHSTDVMHESYDPRLMWGESKVPQTKIVAHVPGWTIFDSVYILNGTVYVVSDEPEKVPDRSNITSTSIPIDNGPLEPAKRLPGDKEMRVISTAEAKALFGTGASRIDGVTWLVNDPPQFITHYYHWSAELFFGLWRTYSSLDPYITPDGETTLPPPRRLVFTHVDAGHWRDYANMNQFVLRAAFPSITGEFSEDWADRAALPRPFVFDRVVFADRAAAMNGAAYHQTMRTASEPFALPGSAHWWSTMRNNVIEFAGLEWDAGRGTMHKPVITYISRQSWGRRMLIPADHEKLVEELNGLKERYGYEVNVVEMDKLSRVQQFQLAGRTTIMMGVHGNGLTSLIWMQPTPRSTVMEFFFPGGYAYDYEYTTRALGMMHYGFWGSRSFTSPDIPPVNYPEGFQGNAIPIDATLVARLCHERLSLSEEADD